MDGREPPGDQGAPGDVNVSLALSSSHPNLGPWSRSKEPGMLFLTVEYADSSSGPFSALESEDSSTFSDDQHQNSDPSLSSIDSAIESVYGLNKSVIVSHNVDTASNTGSNLLRHSCSPTLVPCISPTTPAPFTNPGEGRGLSDSPVLGSTIPSTPAIMETFPEALTNRNGSIDDVDDLTTTSNNASILRRIITSDAYVRSASGGTTLDSSLMSPQAIPPDRNNGLDCIVSVDESEYLVNHYTNSSSHNDHVLNEVDSSNVNCPFLSLDPSDDIIMPSSAGEIMDSRFPSHALDKIEFVVDNNSGSGLAYTSEQNNLPNSAMLSLRPLMNSDMNPIYNPKGGALVVEQGEDGELRLRRSTSPQPEDFQDLLEVDARFLEAIQHQVQFTSIIDDLPLKNEVVVRMAELRATEPFALENQDVFMEPSSLLESSQLVSQLQQDRGQRSSLTDAMNLPSHKQEITSENLGENVPLVLPQGVSNIPQRQAADLQKHPRPALAEKTFKIMENKINLSSEQEQKNDVKKGSVFKALNGGWLNGCDSCLSDDCVEHVVQSICDKPVLSRAWATLPAAFLAVNKFTDLRTRKTVTGVFARKMIPKHTQFGPLEGILIKKDDLKYSDMFTRADDTYPRLEFLLETEAGCIQVVDLSDENHSNWMRFVRTAENSREQNVVLCQHERSLYFRTIRDIPPRHELLVWYASAYAIRLGLPLEPTLTSSIQPWSCFKCNAVFNNSIDIQKHLNNHDNAQNGDEHSTQLKPAKCSHTMRKQGLLHFTLKKSKTNVDKESAKSHQCNSCKRVFPRRYSLKRHMLMHARDRKLTCSKCSIKFGDLALKERHMRTVHKIEPIILLPKKNPKILKTGGDCSLWNAYICAHCSVMFNDPSLLALHAFAHALPGTTNGQNLNNALREYQLEDGRAQCSECGCIFSNVHNLALHVSLHGKNGTRKPKRKIDPNKPFRCDQCYKGFANEDRLQHHMLVHGSEESKPIQCNVCLKRFLNNSALACHVKTHTNQSKMFDCPICKDTFPHVIALREHIQVHSVNGNFTCPYCKKQFIGYGPVRKHIRAFHNERTQKCGLCNNDFPTLDKLRMHMLRHSDHREFLCANCGKQFKRKDKLKEHMKRMHDSNHPPKPRNLPRNEKPIMKKRRKGAPRTKRTFESTESTQSDYDRYMFKCHPCLQGFKRRGMLVNHLAKRHPNINPDEVPELNMPILKTTRDYFCQYCEKIYKSSSKRKAHILKYHPGAELPVNKARDSPTDHLGQTQPPFSQTAGTEATQPHSCTWCYKQYATNAKLLQHQRSKHADKVCPGVQKKSTRKKTKHSNAVVNAQNDSNSTDDNLILTSCNMPLLADFGSFHDDGDKRINKKDESTSTDLLSQAMSEFTQPTEYVQYQSSVEELQLHLLSSPRREVYSPYPPR